MATYYLDSAAGSNTSPFDTWAKAATAWANITLANNDVVYVASTHNEVLSGAASVTLTSATGIRVICADKTSGEPPVTSATGAIMEVQGASHNLTLASSSTAACFFYGITFKVGASQTTGCSITLGAYSTCDTCQFWLQSNNGGSTITINSMQSLRSCSWKVGHASNTVSLVSSHGAVINGLTLLSGGTNPTNLFTLNSSGGVFLANVDASNAANTVTIVNVTGLARAVFRKVKMPTGWDGVSTGSYCSSQPTAYLDFINVSSGTTGLNARRMQFGTVLDEATFVRSGGSTVSRNVSAEATAVYPYKVAQTEEIEVYNSTTGSSVTATIELLTDNASAITNKDVWARLRYSDDASTPHGAIVTNLPAGPLEAGTSLTSSSASWTTTGMSNPQARKIALSFTPQQVGPVYISVYSLGTTPVYVDTLVTLS